MRDVQTQTAIDARIARLRLGNFGDCDSVGQGVYELRIHVGPGYRVYFARTGQAVVLLLLGGSKRTQAKDIRTAKRYWQEYMERGPR